jgi:hypothetical protein
MTRETTRVLGGAAVFAALCASASCTESASAPRDRMEGGAKLYAELCAGCHGAEGEGKTGPSLRDFSRGEPTLADIIDRTMPLGSPERCKGDCAKDVAAYVMTLRGAVACAPPIGERGLRLLTRREYVATVVDLFGPKVLSGTASSASCNEKTFTFDPKGKTYGKVHVAGSFNGWPGTIAAGGWAMQLAGGIWSTKRTVPDGTHQYKLVLDESQWITDPLGQGTVPDGFGGQNSVLTVACASGTAALSDPTASFPPETRPEGFLFDDHGPGRVVSTLHVEQYLGAAAEIAQRADVVALAPCDRAAKGPDACAGEIAKTLARRVFRRPPTQQEIDRAKKLVLAQTDFEAGVRAALRAMLASPSFLYRSELGAPVGDGTYRLTPFEIASALSYGFWGTTPDDELLAAAEAGELSSPAGIEKQARRLLASPRARDMVALFGEQWLGAEVVTTVDKSPTAFPEMTPELREAMREETRRFVAGAFFDGARTPDTLFIGTRSFANGPLAALYGIPGVSGAAMREIELPKGVRAGVLGHASVLAATAHSDQTSPIRRGLFVRRRLLCQEFPPPPPNAGGIPKVDPNATTRERFAQHTADPACASCHKYIDGIGFGFERFDPIGRVRDAENGKPVEARGDMNDVEGLGTKTSAPFSSLPELGATLAASRAAKACVATQYWRFARGHAEKDACALRPVLERFEQSGWDLREMMIATVLASDFVTRK